MLILSVICEPSDMTQYTVYPATIAAVEFTTNVTPFKFAVLKCQR